MNTQWNLEPLNLSDFETGTKNAQRDFIQAFGDFFTNQGFVFLTGHHTEASTIHRYYKAAANLICGTSAEGLHRYELVQDGIERGYVSSPSGGLKPSTVTLRDATQFLFASGLKFAFRQEASKAEVKVSDATESMTLDLPSIVYDMSNPQSETVVQFKSRTLKFRRHDDQNRYVILAPDDKHGWITGMGHNIYPTHAKEFADLSLSLYQTQTLIGTQAVRALGLFLGDKSQTLVRLVTDESGNNIAAHALRIYQYPGLARNMVEPNTKDEAYIRIGEHRDISLLTVLTKSNLPGLQIQARDGAWHDIRAPEGSMIIMAGEMLAHMTRGCKDVNGRTKEVYAPLHRVVGNVETVVQDRYTAPFFFNADLRQPIRSLVNQEPLTIENVTLNPGLRLVYEHIKSSTQLGD